MERNDPHQVELFDFLMQNSLCMGLQLEYLKSVINNFTLFVDNLDKTINIQPYIQPNFDLEKFKKLIFSCWFVVCRLFNYVASFSFRKKFFCVQNA